MVLHELSSSDAVECAAKLISMENHHGQDALLLQARAYIDTTIMMYVPLHNQLSLIKISLGSADASMLFARLYILLSYMTTFINDRYDLQRSLDPDFFLILKQITDTNPEAESMRDFLLRDTLARAAENDYASFQPVINNLQTYIEVVHHENYNTEAMRCNLM
jgi:hypothetical protein